MARMLDTTAPALAGFDPLVSDWFYAKFREPTAPQLGGWPHIRAGRDTLICAPTGSGKTLSAFLICLDALVRKARHELLNETSVLYVSPLKALTNDVQKNLESPLAEITERAANRGVTLAPIRAAVRTGDTTPHERQRMLRHRPHILVTTPESLYIFLTAEKSRELLRTVSTVIVDEIHAVADDKRGSHLALTLARLDHLVIESGAPKPQRIGLSATVKPVEEVARFLSPNATIVDVGHRRAMELAVEVPRDELGAVASNEMWAEIYDRLAQLITEHRTSLIFVNTRRLAERVSHALAGRVGEGLVLPHHGSLSRSTRLGTEARLKSGDLRAVVATASLELGIDIGSVDLVVQLGSPRSIAVGLQRIGRSGHWVGAKPKGILIATTRDELLECAAVVRSIRKGELDKLEVPAAPLDILAQQIVAACAADEWSEDELFATVRAAHPYRFLERNRFDQVVTMLSDGVATSRGRAGAMLHRDLVHGRVRGRRGARLAAITSGGAIPDSTTYVVIAEPEEMVVGTLDEDFAVESMAGDIFLLGTHSWMIRRVEQGRVRVEDAHGAPPTIPFWRGEAPGRTRELSAEFSEVREAIAKVAADHGRSAAIDFLMVECALDKAGAEQAVDYVLAGRKSLGVVPTTDRVVAERFFDEAGGMQLIVHAPFGARINRAWGLSLRKRFCRSFNLELQAAATDNGIVISLSEQHAFPLDIIFEFLKEQTVEHVLTQALLASPMFTARWRWNASRALAILRFRGGRKVAAPIQRMQADDLVAAVFPDQAACAENLSGEIRIPDHPLVNETIDNCLHEAMDLRGLQELLRNIQTGMVHTIAVDTPEPSPFSHEILNANPYAFLDDAPLEERRARAVQMRRTQRVDGEDGLGLLDPEAIASVAADAWPVVRDADELHDALLTLGALPPTAEWVDLFESLLGSGRATIMHANGNQFWVPAEKLDVVKALYPDATASPPLPKLELAREVPESADEALAEVLRGWLESTGPVTVSELAERFAIGRELVETALVRLETQGQVLRGRFSSQDADQWCNRRILARIHRQTLGKLRREIEPVSSAQFMQFLFRWQHVAPGTQLHGADGALQVIRQLEGYEAPAAAWESHILPRRVFRYRPELLDRLCTSGEVMWGRLSAHPAFEAADTSGRRVRPTRVAPVAIFLREHAQWLVRTRRDATPALSPPAREIADEIGRRGALFFAEIVHASGRLPSEVEGALWELVAAGLVTADGFDNLRSLIDPKRRLAPRARTRLRPRNVSGRWALLPQGAKAVEPELVARQLLARWGVLFRDLLGRETQAPPWRDLLVALRRMEARGEIRGGRFVSGYVGEQFALPEAVESLRALRRAAEPSLRIELSPADPLNLVGIILPGERTSPTATGRVAV